ncbi:hypothetical protein M8J77_013404 [Diaphorina citri]|nr:hypothetical protein M8J77_013404 [Diaphorina citri]
MHYVLKCYAGIESNEWKFQGRGLGNLQVVKCSSCEEEEEEEKEKTKKNKKKKKEKEEEEEEKRRRRRR